MQSVTADKSNILLPSYRGRLLEGITYNKANHTLLWVDIIKAEVHRLFLENDEHQSVVLSVPGESIGTLGLTADPDAVLVCCKSGVAVANFKEGTIRLILEYPLSETQAKRLRSNDGIIDPWGNLWVGLMSDFPIATAEGVAAEGLLYRIDAKDRSVKVMLQNTLISNGLAFSDDGSKFYWTDSLTLNVWQFDYDNVTKTLSNKKSLVDMRDIYPENNSPEPDGLGYTSDGHFFHAVYGTSSVVQYDAARTVYAKYFFPANKLTCATVGGKNDDILFVTTAHEKHTDFGVDVDALDKEGDLGGHLFLIKLDKPANSQHKFLSKFSLD